MGVDASITSLAAADRPRWEDLWAQYQRFYEIALPDAVTKGTWERIQAGRIHAFGARDATGLLLGIVHYLYHEDTWSLAPACYLQDLYVDPACRGAGCGRQLISAVADAARAAGSAAPYWLTHESNATARRLYDRVGRNLGFVQYSYTHA